MHQDLLKLFCAEHGIISVVGAGGKKTTIYRLVAAHNGRVGRMLIALLLEHWQLLRNPLLYISVYLKERQADYYRHLERVRNDGSWQAWFEFFLAGVQAVATDATERARLLHRRVADDRRALLVSEGVTVSAMQLFEYLPNHPVVTMPGVTRLLGVTKPTAGKAIDALIDTGILFELGKRRRDRLYSYRPYLDLLQ